MRLVLLLAVLIFAGLLWFTRAEGGLAVDPVEGPVLPTNERDPSPPKRAPRPPDARSPAATPESGPAPEAAAESWPDLDPAWRERGEWLLFGRVLLDGEPFPACRLRVDGTGADDVRLRTDELGRFRLAAVPLAVAWTIEVLSVTPSATVDVRSQPARAPGEIVVHVGTASVAGRAFDTHGVPVADLPIAAQVLLTRGSGPRFETRTDATGSYRLAGLPAGRVVLRGGSVPPNSRELALGTGEDARGVDFGRSPSFPEVSVTLRLPDGRSLVPPAGSLHLVAGPGGTLTLEPVPGACWRGRVPPGEYRPVSRLPLVEERLTIDAGSSAITLDVRGAVLHVRAAPAGADSLPYRLLLLVDEATGEVLDRETVQAGGDAWFAGLAPGRYAVTESDEAGGVTARIAGTREVVEVESPLR